MDTNFLALRKTLLTFVVEALNTVYASTFVVASKDEKVLWVFDLVRQQQADGLERLLAAVHIVAHKEVVGFGREPAVLKEPQKIKVLAVDVAYPGNQQQFAKCDAIGLVYGPPNNPASTTHRRS